MLKGIPEFDVKTIGSVQSTDNVLPVNKTFMLKKDKCIKYISLSE